MEKLPVNLEDVKKAQECISGYARRTQLLKSYYFSALTKGEVYLKLENTQLAGAFKFRGAFNKIYNLSDEKKKNGLIACSSGNHAQGSALSSKILGIDISIYMPTQAPKAKIEATKGYGANVILAGETFDEAKDACLNVLEKENKAFIHPFDDEFVIAGQGTIGLEILEDLPDVDTVVAPIGGGGVLSGLAIALKQTNPNITLIGVESENCQSMKESVENKEITYSFKGNTIADGCLVKEPGNLTFEISRKLVDVFVTSNECDIKRAMKDLIQRSKVVSEGAGALPISTIYSNKLEKYFKNKKVVFLVSGGNVDLANIVEVCK